MTIDAIVMSKYRIMRLEIPYKPKPLSLLQQTLNFIEKYTNLMSQLNEALKTEKQQPKSNNYPPFKLSLENYQNAIK